MTPHDGAKGAVAKGARSPATEPTAADVETYLRRHPAFLSAFLPGFIAEHPVLAVDVLGDALPSRQDDVADFQAHALRHLRRELRSLQAGAQDLLYNARSNLSIQSRTHQAVLAALRAPTFEVLVRTVSDDLPIVLDVDLVMLCVERGLPKRTAIHLQTLDRGAVDCLIGTGQGTRLRSDIKAEPALYGAGVGIVQSDALVRLPLSSDMPAALLALGSRRSGTFHPGQGTELLAFLGAVLAMRLAECIERWRGR